MNISAIIFIFLYLLERNKAEEVQSIDLILNNGNNEILSPMAPITSTASTKNEEEHLKVLPPTTIMPIIAPGASFLTEAAAAPHQPIIKITGAACKPLKKRQKIKSIQHDIYDADGDIKDKLNDDSEKIWETTQILNFHQKIKPTTRIENKSNINIDEDINDIWQKLDNNEVNKHLKEKFKHKKHLTEKVKHKKQLKEKVKHKACKAKHKIKHKEKVRHHVHSEVKDHVKHVHSKVKKHVNHEPIHNSPLPETKTANGCLMQETVIIPQIPMLISPIPPPVHSVIQFNSSRVKDMKERMQSKVENKFYNCITNYAGTATITVTQLSVVPVPTTNVSVKTVFAPTTQKVLQVLYTPYTVTKTSTDTMFMIKVTTACKAGCNACELDANGMVLPAGQLPPGIFATPINEVDRNQYDIVGYAGMNPANFKAEFQGYQATVIKQ